MSLDALSRLPPLKRAVRKTKAQKKQRGPRNDGSWTEARFLQFLRSTLRKASVKWGPRNKALNAARRPASVTARARNPRVKWQYQCAHCRRWFLRKQVNVDHIEPVGSLTSIEQLPQFVSRLFCDSINLQVLCKRKCHNRKTKAQT